MTEQEIISNLKYGERVNLECKKAESSLPNSIWETYSSFANTDGGLILLGVEEHLKETEFERRFSFSSVRNPNQRIIEFWNTINSDKVNVNILKDSQVGTIRIKGNSIIWIDIPPADYRNKPVYINGNILKGSFKRNHEGDYHCTEEEVKSMLRDASDAGNDGGLLEGYTMDDIDDKTLRSYRIEFENRNPDHIWNGDDDISFLRNMGGYAVDRNTGKSWLTAAGLLMFGKGLPIRERFDNIRMDFIDKSNLIPGSRWSDRITYDGMWENNLYNFMRMIMPKLVSGLKRPFKLNGMIRDDDTPVHKAIREAITNMMIHADYLVTGILKVVKTDQGFSFSNPGSLKLPIQSIYEGEHSVARNPKIQAMFRMIGYGDNIGSGFPTILGAWGEENWRKPDLNQNEDLHEVTLKLWMVSTMPIECSEYLKKHYGVAYSHLPREAQIILGTAYLEGSVSNARMQPILDLQSIDIGKILSDLVEKSMLVSHKKGRWTDYTINEGYIIQPEQGEFADIEINTPSFNSDNDRLIYEYIKSNGFITSKQVIEITTITTEQGAVKALNRLISRGLIIRIRHGRDFTYELLNN